SVLFNRGVGVAFYLNAYQGGSPMNNPERDVQVIGEQKRPTGINISKLLIYSFIGAFTFFVPIPINGTSTILYDQVIWLIPINGTSTILLDHIVTFFEETFPNLVPYYILLVIIFGAVHPFITKSWNKDIVNVVLSMFKIVGMIVAFMLIFHFGPNWLFDPDMGPYLFDNLVISVGTLVPVGAAFLALLVGYGFLEFIGVLVQPIMKPVWRTPGRSAIDAVASFVG